MLPRTFQAMTIQDPAWNMDTGASSHLADNTGILTSFSNSSIYPFVFVGNGHSIPITHTGHSFLHTSSKSLQLNHILVTPHIIKNLIHVRKFTRDNDVSVEFDAYGFSVKDYPTGRLIIRCDCTGNLYPVTQQPSSQTPVVLLSFSSTTWHRHLGHPGDDVLRRLESSNLISCRQSKFSSLCHACQLDIWTSSIPSERGIKYYAIFFDHFSHFLEPRSTPCIFLGYPANHCGYRCLDLTSNKIIISRRVRFDEDVFPFGNLTSSNKATYDFLLPPIQTTTNVPNTEPFVQHVDEPNNPITPHPTTPPANPPQPNTPSHRLTPIPTLTQTQSHAQTVASHTLIPKNNSSQTVSTHPMVTRAKAGIFKPLERMNCHVTTTSPLLRSHVHALRDPNWKEAMLDEYNALITNGTWVLVPRPANVYVVCSMWLFKHKFHADDSLSRYKARLVANGRSQQHGIDCDETFSPVVKLATIRTILSLAISRDWPIHQLDMKNAFLYGQLSETNCNTCKTPVDTESKLGSDGDPVSNPTLYSSLAGTLQYLTFTRPDLSYVVQQVCLYMHDPRDLHFTALRRILRYVRGTLDYGLQLHVSSTTQLTAYIDADWAGCPVTRRSTSGYCMFLGDNLLSLYAKRQVALSRFSVEVEYHGVANVVAETAWIRKFVA
nr:ribonuclease H-like domain-containing protein [Tanacetum cinerariifolium]